MDTSFETRVSIELVPRDLASLQEALQQVRGAFRSIDLINIPDLPRFALRSWEGCVAARRLFPHAIPHIRARDVAPDQPLAMADTLRTHDIREVLLVTGDPDPNRPDGSPGEGSRATPPAVLHLIRRFKKEIPGLRVYAAIDPYRQGFQQECAYAQQKLEAGADGLFTQPFFDLRLMEIYAELLEKTPIFWGVSPVMTDKSRAYWENRNRAIFPRQFAPTLAWNRHFAEQVLTFAKQRRDHVYFMPIRIDVVRYLGGILS